MVQSSREAPVAGVAALTERSLRQGARDVRLADSSGAGDDEIVVPSLAWTSRSGRATRMGLQSELPPRSFTLALQMVVRVLLLGGSREDFA